MSAQPEAGEARNGTPAPDRVSLVVAMTRQGVIGRAGGLPWRLPDDLRHLRRLTWGHPVVLGRRTYESVGKPLPGRTNIVLTRRSSYAAPGCHVVHTPEAALAAARAALQAPVPESSAHAAGEGPALPAVFTPHRDEVMILGGAEIYALFLPRAQRMYVTHIDADIAGDTVFPPYDTKAWRERARVAHPADARHAVAFAFVVLERR